MGDDPFIEVSDYSPIAAQVFYSSYLNFFFLLIKERQTFFLLFIVNIKLYYVTIKQQCLQNK